MFLVTGGAGFIGSNIVRALSLSARFSSTRIIIFDHFNNHLKWNNLRNLVFDDLLDPSELFPFIEKNRHHIECVIHMGAISSTTASDLNLLVHTNLNLTIKLWDICSRYQLRLIYASSASTYGNGEHGFIDSGNLSYLSRLSPLNPYGWSKSLTDIMTQRRRLNGIHPSQWVSLKFFNVYGPNEGHKNSMMSLIPQVLPMILEKSPVRLFKSGKAEYSHGEQVRDFVYVSDITSVTLWLLENNHVCGIFNVGSGKSRSFNDLVRFVSSAVSIDAIIEYVDMPKSIANQYQYKTEADISKLRKAGYLSPMTSLESGIHDYVTNYLLSTFDLSS
jgi:ADP-L-glycero-D-manno-heptose 6-epimerase